MNLLRTGLISALCCAAVAAMPTNTAAQEAVAPVGRERCAAIELSELEKQLVESQLENLKRNGRGAEALPDRITVPVYFHIVTRSNGEGNVSSLVNEQMQVLNKAFAPRFRFRLVKRQVVVSDKWFLAKVNSPAEIEMKEKLRLGGPDALNIYTTNADVFLGWATFPQDVERFPLYDGIVLYWAALPGGGLNIPAGTPNEPDGFFTYDLGDTGVHEVGHWLGLYHTFEGGCSPHGDFVSDTPSEREERFFCVARDSCKGANPRWAGSDPIHNFMDYVDDACMFEFTPKQGIRMGDMWAFRDN